MANDEQPGFTELEKYILRKIDPKIEFLSRKLRHGTQLVADTVVDAYGNFISVEKTYRASGSFEYYSAQTKYRAAVRIKDFTYVIDVVAPKELKDDLIREYQAKMTKQDLVGESLEVGFTELEKSILREINTKVVFSGVLPPHAAGNEWLVRAVTKTRDLEAGDFKVEKSVDGFVNTLAYSPDKALYSAETKLKSQHFITNFTDVIRVIAPKDVRDSLIAKYQAVMTKQDLVGESLAIERICL